MWPYHPELLETPVPRYTSYPTAVDFGELPTAALTHAIEGASGDISLYLHIPFCESICHYCGCNTGKANRKQRVESYLAALHTEIETVASLLPRDARVRRIAFGGGSPNAIEPSQFIALVDALGRNFWLGDCEWSIELDPRSMSSVWGEAVAEAGITRASMGVQTFAAHCQKAIGREQSDAMICRSIDWLRDAGVTSLNFDLMYGLPHQSADDLADSLEYTKLLGADRIAVFGYAHVPHLIARQRIIDAGALPDAKARFDMAAMAHEFLTNEGYDAIGFDHFALPRDPMAIATQSGRLRRNFQGFSDDPGEVLIGLGASAISGFPHLIAQNEKNNGRYRMKASQGMLTSSVGVVRNREDQMRGKVIEDLLCKGFATLPPCIYASCGIKLDRFIGRSLARFDGMTFVIQPAGLPYARAIAAQFDQFREVSQRRFSSAI
ncbi:oxygen-independent coproporphyrinogen III oxidase [Erythrobacter sp. F6033]|uniref:oxygen-independent coproporphyrinogen III oxidase n=1 Tax=Erythrobacter sp. F6033 TaxID=2926401 RepID=UPI001FF2CB8F|nr:oxygen-independent coproporphyrinogen III oxidase [Erythrobacter sp. F6033]MCK0127569.1 oxygen-independent coproporphyrinogen III oxidase [Erythrobacter sp. F6033]